VQAERQQRVLGLNYGSEVDSQDEDYQDLINEAIIQSIFEHDQNEEEEKLLREVMKLSALEHKKQIGELDLQVIKKRNPPQAAKKHAVPADFVLPPLQQKPLPLRQSLGMDELSEQILNEVEPQNARDVAKLREVKPDPLREEQEQQQAEEAKALQTLTPEGDAKKSQLEEIKELISPQKKRDWLNSQANERSNGFDDLIEGDLDISAIQPRNEDKQRIREIMAKRRDASQAQISSINRLDDTNISSIPPSNQHIVHLNDDQASEEDDFDKLIGHIEGSRAPHNEAP